MRNSDPLSVAVLSIDSAFEVLRNDWQAPDPAGAGDPTLSVEWLQVWWRNFGKPGTDRILALVSTEDRILGLLFTRIETEYYHRLPVKTVRCWVNSHAQRASLFLRCDANAAAKAFADHWARSGRQWDLLRLQGLPDGEFGHALLYHANLVGCRCDVVREWGHSWLDIDRPWEEYWRDIMSSETRRTIDRQGRRLARLGTITSVIHQTAQGVEDGFGDLMKIETESWKRSAGEIVASHPVVASFYSDISKTFAGIGKAGVAVLYLDRAPICAAILLITDCRILILKSSYTEQLAKHSPGTQLFKQVLAHAFSKGFKEVDFYGKMAFTQRWTKDEQRFIDLEICGRTIRSRAIILARTAKHWWAARSRKRQQENSRLV